MKETADPAGASHTQGTGRDTPTIEAEDARIAIGDSTMMDGLSLRTRGDRVLLIGSAEALVAAISGSPGGDDQTTASPVARVVSGSLRVAGADVAAREHVGLCGVAPLDPPMPLRWTVQEYLSWGARLGGARRRQAKALALAALERLGLTDLRRRRLKALARHERRALAVTLAIVTNPSVIVLEDPLAKLDESDVTAVMAVMAQAAVGRAVILSMPHLSPRSPAAHLARTATDICVFRGGELLLVAEPATLFDNAAIYEITVKRGAAALRRTLAEQGLELHGGPEHFSLSLPKGRGPSDVLAAAAQARAAVTSCIPLL
ncbi:MAG: ABC transporter ATP-binding protein [Deltaproteobacteria bacterium]|nr:MAG: ABC transporter ATP-binding protein [Deltaproteobacteria bacterium]